MSRLAHAPSPKLAIRAAHITMAIVFGVLAGMWFANMGRVVVAAISAPTHADHASHVVVLGKRLSNGQVDQDFQARLHRAAGLLAADPGSVLLISGGGTGTSEAQAGLNRLQIDLGHALDPARVLLEQASSSTAENLLHVRQMLPGHARIAVVSSRYHLARVSRLAAQMALPVDLVAAEPGIGLSMAMMGSMFKEAIYLTALDIRALV